MLGVGYMVMLGVGYMVMLGVGGVGDSSSMQKMTRDVLTQL